MQQFQLPNTDPTPRATDKRTLAMRYFPHSTPSAAMRRLERWMNQAHELQDALRATGYRPRNRILTPRQTSIVYEYPGEP